MNEALDIYAENEKVICIHGYTYPVKENLPDTFFSERGRLLGMGNMEKRLGFIRERWKKASC